MVWYHQLIHFKYCHSIYWTPRKRFLTKTAVHPYCNYCPQQPVGTFLHMVWERGDVNDILSALVGQEIPVDPAVLLLNDDSNLNLTGKQRKMWLAGLTSAKKSGFAHIIFLVF